MRSSQPYDNGESILSCFPFPEMRGKQQAVLQEIEDAYKSGINTIMLEAPVGFGKSPVATAFTTWLGTSYTATGTKDLQAQYVRDFPWLRVGKGRSNFECYEIVRLNEARSREEMMADKGPCTLDSKFECGFKPDIVGYYTTNDNTPQEQVLFDKMASGITTDKPCSYYDQKFASQTASHSVYNYAFFLLQALGSKGLPIKRVFVGDECHTLESVLTEFQGVSISSMFLKRFFDDNRGRVPDLGFDLDMWRNWIKNLDRDMVEFIDIAKAEKGTRYEYREQNIAEAKNFRAKLKVTIEDMDLNPSNWIVASVEKDNEKNSKVTLKPLNIAGIAQRMFGVSSARLLMSATILGKEAFCSMLGFDPANVKFISVDSDFPLENRPIYPLNVGQLNARNKEAMLPKFASVVERIMNMHSSEKGIIHTTSYEQLKYIKATLSVENRRRLLETGDAYTREELIEEHSRTSKPTVLISPSLHTGLDLAGDLSRFQVIFKMPYPDLSDRVVEAKKNRNPYWYNWQTCIRVVQAYGRSIRSKDDWAKTYILDSNFGFLERVSGNLLPVWFKSAIVRTAPPELGAFVQTVKATTT